MTYTDAKRAEYPQQDETALLIDFAAEVLARREFAATGHASMTWGEWIGNRAETRESRMEPYLETARRLSAIGMLTWPTTETTGITWTVEGPGQIRGLNAAPSLDWIQPFGRNSQGAVGYFRACATTGQPCRLSWSFGPRKGGLNGG
ncbi:hypothetical protein IV500_04295 [Paeniglutamicibacter antarcticus]|uniref:Uncharacterized protein n=1 Tax=Arthrobacter terrae TaxID=2935737 RepID=A0A931G3G4_9MICC|nr:hypothetical protein [Arthrobacter terrae]MBG0738641.1 hypothetical protein [Arthrobacter terrae]